MRNANDSSRCFSVSFRKVDIFGYDRTDYGSSEPGPGSLAYEAKRRAAEAERRAAEAERRAAEAEQEQVFFLFA